MSTGEYLIDTNILIYHTKGSQLTIDFITTLIANIHLISQSLQKLNFLDGISIPLMALKDAKD